MACDENADQENGKSDCDEDAEECQRNQPLGNSDGGSVGIVAVGELVQDLFGSSGAIEADALVVE